jgi:hypothetical protein
MRKCLWCKEKNKIVVHNDKCYEKIKRYRKRFLPLFFWRLYSNYKIYTLFYAIIPKYKKIVFKENPKKLLRYFLKIIKKIKVYFKYNHFHFEKTKTCGHWIFYKTRENSRNVSFKKNFCNNKCRDIEKKRIKEKKKQRNLLTWGTEERPNEEKRKVIQNIKNCERDKKRKKEDPAYKLIRRMRVRTKKILGVNYRRTTNKTDVYTRLCVENGNDLKKHLEFLWKPGMSWNNYGTKDGWVIDHIVPLKYYKDNFDLINNIDIQKKAFGKNNLQPLWWVENSKKAAKLIYLNRERYGTDEME